MGFPKEVQRLTRMAMPLAREDTRKLRMKPTRDHDLERSGSRRGVQPGWNLNQPMKKILVLAIAMASLTALSASAADGKALYDAQCAKCHGKDGAGQTAMGKRLNAKDYTKAATWEGLTDEKAVKAVKEGFKVDGKDVMKPSEATDEEAKAMVAYMRTLKK